MHRRDALKITLAGIAQFNLGLFCWRSPPRQDYYAYTIPFAGRIPERTIIGPLYPVPFPSLVLQHHDNRA